MEMGEGEKARVEFQAFLRLMPNGEKAEEVRAALERLGKVPHRREIDLLDLEEVAQTKVSISVKDATVSDIVEAIGTATSKPKRIEVRSAQPISVTLSMLEMEVGKILKAAAALAGCEFYLLPDRFLIAPLEQLRAEERNYTQTSNAYRETLLESALAKSMVSELNRRGLTQTIFSEIDAHYQKVLQRLVNIQAISGRWEGETLLPSDARISLETNQLGAYKLKVWLSQAKHWFIWSNMTP